MSLEQINRLRKAFSDAVAPVPDLKVSEWARKNFRTSSDYSSVVGEFIPHPYQIEPLDVLSSSDPSEMMVMMCAAQMMKTLILLILLGYIVDHDPGPALIVQPTGDDAESFSTERIGPMLTDVPAVAAKMSAAEGKGRVGKILQKRFRGGQVSLTGAISDSGLRRRSVRYLMLDEVDAEGYGATTNGDRIKRATMRTVTYWNRKIILCSTPSVPGSRILTAYEQGDQRQYFVPCPFCGHEQPLLWERVRWGYVEDGPDGKPNTQGRYIAPEDARYHCRECQQFIPHHHKTEMLRAGRWVAQNADGRYPSFQISRLYAPDWSWGRVVTELFLPAKDSQDAMRQFRNEVLGLPFIESGEVPDWEKLMNRRENGEDGKPLYRLGSVPPGVLFLTAGVDVQKSWLQGHVWGWGRGRQRWILDRWILEGDPYHEATWDRLTERLNTTYRHPGGADLAIVRMAVDSGFATQEVYRWARQQGSGRVMVVKGQDSGAALVTTPQQVEVSQAGKRIKHGARVYMVNVSMCKSELYGLLAKDRPADGEPFPPGWVHFAADLDEEFFRQLTAEQLVSRVVKGYRKHEWVKTRERNEDLDCANYARAAASVFGVDRFSEHKWREFEIAVGSVSAPIALPAAAPMVAPVAPPPPQQIAAAQTGVRQSGWFDRGRTGNWLRR